MLCCTVPQVILTANDRQRGNDPQIVPQMIPEVYRKWSQRENDEWHGYWFLGFFFKFLSFFFFFYKLKDKLDQIKEKIYWQFTL